MENRPNWLRVCALGYCDDPRMLWPRLRHALEELIMPRTCVFCGVPSAVDEQYICAGCYADLPWNRPAVAPCSGIFERSIAMLHYSFPVDAAIKAFKFDRKLYYAPAFSAVLCCAQELLPMDIDAILPVPLHWRRKALRGFDQAAEIAKPVARMLHVPLVKGVYRKHATPFQSGLGATERARNLRHAFSVRKPLSYQHVLIIDDVVTTGATTQQLARTLFSNGVRKVSVLVVAKAD